MEKSWQEIEREFVETTLSAAAIAKKYQIPATTLRSRIERKGLRRKREDFCGGDQKRQRITALERAADALGDVITEAASDKKQFYRYIVKNKEGSEETVFGKLDTKALRDMAGAIRDMLAFYGGDEKEEEGGVIEIAAEEE